LNSYKNIVEQYDRPGRLLATILNPDFWNKIHDSLKERYNTYLLYQYLFTYLAAHCYHHPTKDDKAKIGLDILVIDYTFKTMQSTNEPVTIEDNDISKGNKMKLISLIYLLIDPANSNTMLHSEQTLDLDYLTVHTHALYQSTYNPVER
ncbi:42639_t:CDS:2, partial [Gigaspora margarita]